MKFLGLIFVALLPFSVMANPAHEKIASMSESDRGAILAKLLSNGGERCPSSVRTFYQGADKQGNAYWNIQCAGGASYMIQVKNNATGSTSVLECVLMKKANIGTCFKKF